MAHDDASDGDDKSGDGIGLCSATMLLMTIVCLNLSVVVGVHRILWLNNSPNARKANKQTNETGKESIQHLHCSTTRHEQKLSETNFPDYSLEYFSSSPPLEFTTLTQFSSQLCAPFQVVGICCVADSWVAHFPAFLIEWNYTVFSACMYYHITLMVMSNNLSVYICRAKAVIEGRHCVTPILLSNSKIDCSYSRCEHLNEWMGMFFATQMSFTHLLLLVFSVL